MTIAINWITAKRKISELKDYDRNPRKLGKEEFKKLVESLKEDGYHNRIAINLDNVILGGHQRKKALLAAGWKPDDEIEVLVPDKLLVGDEFDRINIRDNLPYGSFDFDILANNFDATQLIEWGMPAEWLPVNSESEEEGIDNQEVKSVFNVTVECEDESDQEAVFKLMQSKGYKCKVSSI